jgi:hypothetical protein
MIKVKFNESMIVAAEGYVHSHGGRSGFFRFQICDVELCSEWRQDDPSQYYPTIDSYQSIQYSTDLILCHELLVINDPESSHFYIVKYPYPNDIKIYKDHVVEIDEHRTIPFVLGRDRLNVFKHSVEKEPPADNSNKLWDDNLDNLFDK